MKERLKGSAIKCRTCGGEHWTSKCPYKDTLGVNEDLQGAESESTTPTGTGAPAAAESGSGRYMPPHLRNRVPGATGDSMYRKERNDEATLRVTNLSEFITEDDLRELFRHFGGIQRIYLAKDRETNMAKGFAFVSFYDREAAVRARDKMDGFGYDNLIMRVCVVQLTDDA